jgi:hypothetical protein
MSHANRPLMTLAAASRPERWVSGWAGAALGVSVLVVGLRHQEAALAFVRDDQTALSAPVGVAQAPPVVQPLVPFDQPDPTGIWQRAGAAGEHGDDQQAQGQSTVHRALLW